MAKRQKVQRFSIQGWDMRHYRETEAYAQAVQSLYDKATLAITRAAARGKIDPDTPFSFDMYPSVQKEMQRITEQLAERVTVVIESGSKKQWLFACDKNDAFISSIMDTSKVSKARLKKMQDRNLDPLAAFQGRKVDGMNLSQRVWKYVGQFKDQLENALDVGLGEGRSADELSRDVRQNLRDPNRLFRRVRDKRGNLVLSKRAAAFHPGRGVYRSSYKNAMRLTRSEINMAYRESDWQRWQSLDFVVGFEIHRSNHEPLCECDICEKLVGRYPKTFKFKGWHPQCMCYATPVLMDEETFDENELGDLKAALRGTTYKHQQAKNAVSDVPDGFKAWVKDHVEAQRGWASTPYFIKDNFVDGQLGKGLKIAMQTVEPNTPVVAKGTPKMQPTQLDDVFARIDKEGIEYREVKPFTTQPTDTELIERIGGGDKTSGSCASLAFAFAANKGGLDVLDFRGGKSLDYFSTFTNLMQICDKVGGYSSFSTTGIQLMKQTQPGKLYYLVYAQHAAIVRQVGKGKYEFLELQHSTSNGWKPLDSRVFSWRFGGSGRQFGLLMDIELLQRDSGFQKMVGYINTAQADQRKGMSGTIK